MKKWSDLRMVILFGGMLAACGPATESQSDDEVSETARADTKSADSTGEVASPLLAIPRPFPDAPPPAPNK